MTLLYRIIYAAHANGSHHKLALDALKRLGSPSAQRWRRLFLKHAETYLIGSTAPDKEFKDFSNHVLHVGDDYWGGAPEKAKLWYERTITALQNRSWSEAVYAAGVLSHYYTDPIHPFHTAQSEEENNIHRAVEWSINRAYDSLRREGEARHASLSVLVPNDADWLRQLVIEGAETSNRHYQKLIAEYNFEIGVNDPPAGLNDACRAVVSELIIYAAEGFARILDRAFVEGAVEPPEVELTAETVVASLKIPVKWVEKKLADNEDRATVRAMYDELNATGKVERTLPEDDRQVRASHQREVLEPRRRQRNERLRLRLAEGYAVPDDRSHDQKSHPNTRTLPPAAPAGDTSSTTQAADVEQGATNLSKAPNASGTDKHDTNFAAVPAPAPEAEAITVVEIADSKATNTSAAAPRIYLSEGDNIVDAPSIGPKTAQRFYAIGVNTVAEFLAADPDRTASELDTRHITSDTLRAWQAQARLVLTVPGLRGTHAQLLQGAGFASRDAIADASPGALSAAVLAFAATPDGQRVLRDGAPPDIEKMKAWIDNARASSLAA